MRENPLRAWRKARRLTAVAVAHKMALSEQSILCFERGSFEPSQENFDKLAGLMETLPGALRLSWHFWKSDLNRSEATTNATRQSQ